MAAAQPGPPVPPDGIDLVYKYDARGVPFGLVEQVPYARCADPDKHFYKFAAANVEEGYPRLSGNGPGQQGLTGARRSH